MTIEVDLRSDDDTITELEATEAGDTVQLNMYGPDGKVHIIVDCKVHTTDELHNVLIITGDRIVYKG